MKCPTKAKSNHYLQLVDGICPVVMEPQSAPFMLSAAGDHVIKAAE